MAGTVLDRFVLEYVFKHDERQLRRVERRVEATRKRLQKAAVGMGIAGAALTGVFVKIGKTVFDFEVEANALAAAINANETDMRRLREAALELGKTTQFTSSQAMAASKLLGQAGLDVNRTLAAQPRVLELAAAGQLDMGTAAQIATGMLAGFGFEVDQLGRVNDVLAAAASSAKTTVADMGTALSKSAPMARALGVSIEDAAAAVAVLQNNNLAAEEAGVGFRNFMQRLLSVSGPGEEAFDRMGINVAHVQQLLASGQMTAVLEEFRRGNMTARDAVDIFGARAANSALILAGQEEQLTSLQEALRNAGGEARRMSDRQMQGLVGAVKTLASRIENLLIRLGDAGLTGAIMAMAAAVVSLIDAFTALPEVLQQMVAYGIALGPVLVILAALVAVAKFVAGNLLILAGGFALLGKVALGALVFLLSPIGLILAGIAALVAAIVWAVYNWDTITRAVEKFWHYFKLFVAGLKVEAGKIGSALSGLANRIGAWVDDAMAGMVARVKELWASAVAWLQGGWYSMVGSLAAAVDGIWDWLSGIGDGALDWLTAGLQTELDAWGDLVDGIWDWLRGPGGDVFGWLREQFDAAVAGLLDLIPGPVRKLLGIGGTAGSAEIGQAAGGAADAAGALTEAVKGAAEDASTFLAGSDAQQGPFSRLTASGRAIMTTLAAGATAAAPTLAAALQAGLPGITAPLPVGPPAGSFRGLAGGTAAGTSIDISIGEIRIDAPGADAHEIAQNIGANLRDQLDALVYEADSRVQR